MTSLHAWKRRIWGPDYPFENGPPQLDSAGLPIVPDGKPTPFNGISHIQDAPPLASFDITFSGTSGSDEMTVVLWVKTGSRWVGCSALIPPGATATIVADLVRDAFNAQSFAGFNTATAAVGVLTLSVASGTIDAALVNYL